MERNIKKEIKEYFWTTIGFLIVVIAIKFFLAPNKIAGGGVMGIGIIINYLIPSLSVGHIMLILNGVFFLIAFIVIGKEFGAKTIYASLAMSIIISILDKIIPPEVAYTNDLFLATFFGTLLSGVGMGIVFNQNASTGGTDILAKIINKFIHIDIGKSLLIVDIFIAVLAGITFNPEKGMYAIISVIMLGFIIDYVIEGLNKCKAVLIVSSKNDLISEYIIEKLDRGCTIFTGKGGYSKNNTEVLYTVLGRKEFIRLREYIKDIDERAFITITEAHEVLGEGFKNIVEN
ncbi:YitT family protein [Clostridium aestuarii]|uniref:YitT family protein n=1 Tax=Clostridium aestuarii TaxID=338193 RepID=A0ABT4CWD6_9CLOT|nr:YitT family protein [Clostridium aestuarii]MCY6483309.1 YitT family protein [Clostridium aestuarii]